MRPGRRDCLILNILIGCSAMRYSERASLVNEVGKYSIFFSLTKNCNILCRYCSCSPKLNGKGQQLDGGAVVDLLHWLSSKRDGIQTVQLSGGEPFLHRSFFEILNCAKELGFVARVQTNGTLIDGLSIDEINSLRDVRLKVSLDGPTSGVHEEYRQKGSFSSAVRGIEVLSSHGLHVGTKAVFHQGNVEYSGDLIDFSRQIGATSFTYNAIESYGLARSLTYKLASDFYLTKKLLSRLRLRKNWPLLNGTDILRWFLHGSPVIRDKLPYFVDYSGDVYRGQVFSNMRRVGNIYTDNWGGIFDAPYPGRETLRCEPRSFRMICASLSNMVSAPVGA